MGRVRVQEAPFDMAHELAGFGGADAGAEVTFTGIVRPDGGLRFMEIEHYPAMTENAIAAIVAEAEQRWTLGDVRVVHRFGRMEPGERIMMVAVAASHRAEAFAAAEFLMDYLKSRAPFWKKETRDDGSDWVAAKDDDEAALARWHGRD